MLKKAINLYYWAIYWTIAVATVVSQYYFEAFVGPDCNMKTPLLKIIPRLKEYIPK